MRRNSFICFIFVLCASLQGNAQKIILENILFSGVVIDAQTTRPMVNVNCWQGNIGTTTDETGRFVLETMRGDTIRFTHIGYRPYEMIVPDSLDGREYIMAIFLTVDTVALSEAIVLRRYGEAKLQNLQNARSNMSGVLRDAYAPQKSMDADQNQKRIMNDFARSIEYKGMVDVKLGVGTQSMDAFRKLKLQKTTSETPVFLRYDEIDLLKKIFYIKKGEKSNN